MFKIKTLIKALAITALLFQWGGVMAQDPISNNMPFFGAYTGGNQNVIINNDPFFTGGSNSIPGGQYNFVGGSQNTLSLNGNLINSLAYGENNNLSSPNDGLAIGLGGELDLNDASTYALGEQITINSGTSVGIGAQHSIAEETSVALGTGHELNDESNYGFGEGLGVSADEAMAIGFGDGSTGTRLTNNIPNSITMGVEANNMLNLFLDGNGNPVVGINRSSVSPGNQGTGIDLTVQGEAEKGAGTGAWQNFSDERLKEYTKPFEDGLNALMKINPVRFKYNGKLNLPTKEEYIGVVAQEIKDVAPYMVSKNENGYYGYNANAMWYILVNAVQEQQKQLKEEKAESDSLKQKVKGQRKQLSTQQKQLENQQEQIDQLRKKVNRLVQQKESNANRFENSDNLNNKTVSISEQNGEKQAMLLQNRPNPYSGKTIIPYYLPKGFNNANMLITNTNGQIIKRIDLENPGKGELTLRTEGLKARQYLYSLIVDGRKIQTRKMVMGKR